MAHDPLIGQKRLKLGKNEAEFLEADDISALLAAASDDSEASAPIHVMLFGGLRRSEAFGLKWAAVETNGDSGGRLRVCRTIYHGEIIDKTKVDSSNRIVDVPRSVIDALARHGRATPPMDGDVVFRTSTGQPLDPNSWYGRIFKPLRERAEIREGVGLHSLRHTFASLLLLQGEGLKYTSEQLGHSSVQITGDRYGHVFKSQREEAMSLLDETIRKVKRQQFAVINGGAKR